MKIIIPIGISGSGKSKLYKKRYSDLALVSPDIIRKEINGNRVDNRFSDEVKNTINSKINELVEKGESFFYDNTNVNPRRRMELVNQFCDRDDIEIIYVILPADIEKSYARITEDLKNNVDRADVPYSSLERQYEQYQKTMESNFDGENVSSVIYIQPGELDD